MRGGEGSEARYRTQVVMPWHADEVLDAVDALLRHAPVLPPPAREAELILLEAVVDVVRGDETGDRLPEACRRFAEVTDDADVVLACVAAIRQGLSRVASVDGCVGRWHVDEVIDRVLAEIVAYLLAELRDQALTDALTGLGNHRAFVQDLHIEIARAVRSGCPLTVVIIDVDGLKLLNDSEGHGAGDEALRAVGVALRSLVRQSDRAYRCGGDEFALLLTDSIVVDAAVIADRLRCSGAPSCSIGIATSGVDSLEELVSIADRRMYADRRGRRAPSSPSV